MRESEVRGGSLAGLPGYRCSARRGNGGAREGGAGVIGALAGTLLGWRQDPSFEFVDVTRLGYCCT